MQSKYEVYDGTSHFETCFRCSEKLWCKRRGIKSNIRNISFSSGKKKGKWAAPSENERETNAATAVHEKTKPKLYVEEDDDDDFGWFVWLL